MQFDGTVLLVDDELHVRKFIGLILRQLGNPVLIEAANGKDAVEAYKREDPDLVLLDVNMPVQDGIETLRQLMTVDPHCVVVMLTSLANRQTVEQALQLGAANYIRKDTPKDEILAALRQTIVDCFSAE
ncbi:response regulator [Opitutaceae bacterium EW11]|nr:response regulator [Opitutaceae bacterium EW11]